MIEYLLFVCSLVGFYYYITIRKIIYRDIYRDKLFDLRDNLRDFFLENQIPLDNILYKKTRDLINNHLSFIEAISFNYLRTIGKLFFENKDVKEFYNQLDKGFYTSDIKVKRFIDDIRTKSAETVLNYHKNKYPFVMKLAYYYCLFSFRSYTQTDSHLANNKRRKIHNSNFYRKINTNIRNRDLIYDDEIKGLELAACMDRKLKEELSFMT